MQNVSIAKPPYANPREAYQHLLKYDPNPTIPKNKPNAPVTLFIRGARVNWRPYESFEAISRYMNSCTFAKHVIVNAEHLADRYRELQVRKLYRIITGERFDADSGLNAYDETWKLLQTGKLVKLTRAKKDRHGNTFLFDLNKISETNEKFPRQCRVIMTALLEAEISSYTMDDLKVFAANLHKHGLKTKQPPFKILQYYLPQLHDKGFVEYPRKQYGEEE